MSVWFRRGEPQRRQQGTPVFGLEGPRVPLVESSTFATADADRWDTALQSVAVSATVDLITSVATELPVRVFRGEGPEQRVDLPSWLRDPGGDGYGLADWSARVLVSWLLRGNVFGEALERDLSRGHLRQVEVFHPDAVAGWLEGGRPRFSVLGRELTPGRTVHRRVNPVPGQVLGRSPIRYHASTIGVSLASTAFGLQWFTDGAHPSGVLQSTERQVDQTLAQTVKDRFLAALRGTREPVVLDKGWQWERIQIAPEESQFLETQKYSAAECARIFGPGFAEILGYETGGSMTYSNVQDRDIQLLKYALNRWLRRLERLLSDFLPAAQHVQLNRDALLETNTLSRYQAHASALDKRWRTVNEVRELEDLPPVEWGDEPNPTPGAGAEPAGGADEGANES